MFFPDPATLDADGQLPFREFPPDPPPDPVIPAAGAWEMVLTAAAIGMFYATIAALVIRTI